ncbi:bacteriocin-like protein [Chryseobacterium sp. RRHN12]|uniref:bacteriocin-like protein n=1 Tax=Chryseobacterium sp. RRHN12 TaxID=3437884 RepID=UPI003D9AEB8C
MKKLKKLSRKDLKIIKGEAAGDGSSGVYYKCCFKIIDICSECRYTSSTPLCESRAYPVVC